MACPTYYARPSTPPTTAVPELISGSHNRNISSSSTWSSPDSIEIQISTPLDRSPVLGHQLLPKLRIQDQLQDAPAPTHRRAVSQSLEPTDDAVQLSQRSCTVPPSCDTLVSPSSATSLISPFSAGVGSNSTSPISLVPPYLSRKAFGHARSVSASGLDDATIGRFGYPTYRRTPAFVAGPNAWTHTIYPNSSVYTPAPAPQRLQPVHLDLPTEQLCGRANETTMTPLEYLRGPNPPVDLVRQTSRTLGRGMHSHFWWDVRNLQPWTDFTLDTIMAVPAFPDLLNIPVNSSAFPQPAIPAARLRPDSDAALVQLVRDFYMVKINAAMKVTQGNARHLAMRPGPDRDGPTFVSGYQDEDLTGGIAGLAGSGRARVVGLVRPYQRWNSGQRAAPNTEKVYFLEGLSCLQRHMRAHGCRYGFLLSETELVCVRMGTVEGAGRAPYFGLLELAPTVETRHRDGMTACLALWYLHMLAKEKPLQGQCEWRVNVGVPSMMTRANVLGDKDKWIPEPQTGEKRDAKRVRGWVWPKDPFCKKREGGKVWNK